jgi:hypothetical protein
VLPFYNACCTSAGNGAATGRRKTVLDSTADRYRQYWPAVFVIGVDLCQMPLASGISVLSLPL